MSLGLVCDSMGDQADHAAHLTEMATLLGIKEEPIVAITPNDEAVLLARFDTMDEFGISDEEEIKAILGHSIDAIARYRQRYNQDPDMQRFAVYRYYQMALDAYGWRQPLLQQ